MKKKIIIIGKNGFIGSNLFKFFKKKDVIITHISFENFCNKFKIYNENFDFIINCSSNHDFVNKKYQVKNDMSIHKARKILKNKIIGLTCHNSKSLVLKAITGGADYIALGAFFFTKTKKVKYKADINILKYVKNITNIPIVAIGGIKLSNYKKLLLNKANFLAISSYIWNNKKLKPEEAIKRIK